MTEMTFNTQLRQKVLDRWENEGGMIPDGRITTLAGGSPFGSFKKGGALAGSRNYNGRKSRDRAIDATGMRGE